VALPCGPATPLYALGLPAFPRSLHYFSHSLISWASSADLSQAVDFSAPLHTPPVVDFTPVLMRKSGFLSRSLCSRHWKSQLPSVPFLPPLRQGLSFSGPRSPSFQRWPTQAWFLASGLRTPSLPSHRSSFRAALKVIAAFCLESASVFVAPLVRLLSHSARVQASTSCEGLRSPPLRMGCVLRRLAAAPLCPGRRPLFPSPQSMSPPAGFFTPVFFLSCCSCLGAQVRTSIWTTGRPAPAVFSSLQAGFFFLPTNLFFGLGPVLGTYLTNSLYVRSFVWSARYCSLPGISLICPAAR